MRERVVGLVLGLLAAGCAEGVSVPITVRASLCDPTPAIQAAKYRVTVSNSSEAQLLESLKDGVRVEPDALSIFVEALASDGTVLARGSSDRLTVAPAPARPPEFVLELFPLGRFTRRCAPLSVARSSHTATVLLDHSVLIVGGVGVDGVRLVELEQLTADDLRRVGVLRLVSRGERIPMPRSGHAATRTESGQLVISGGQEPGMQEGPLVLDPAASFALGAMAPNSAIGPRSRHAALPFGRTIILAGGVTHEMTAPTQLEEIDLETNRISVKSTLPDARLDAAVAALGDLVVFAGGTEGGLASDKVDLLPVTNPGLPRHRSLLHARTRAAVAANATRALVAGGLDATGSAMGTTEWLTASDTTAGPELAPRVGACALSLGDGRFWLMGGATNSTAELVTEDGLVSTFDFPGEARVDHACTLLSDGNVLITGGLGATSGPLADVWVFAPPER